MTLSCLQLARRATKPLVQEVTRARKGAMGPMVHERCSTLGLPCMQREPRMFVGQATQSEDTSSNLASRAERRKTFQRSQSR